MTVARKKHEGRDYWLAAWLLATLSGCLEHSDSASPQLSVSVAPLTLPGVVDACYSVSVINEANQVVSTRSNACASQFGANGGLTYVASCDATDTNGDGTTTNTVKLTIDNLYAGPGKTQPITDFINPCAAPHAVNGCQLATNCLENADASVVFNLTLMREANQGFFDIGVNFDDVFCSAKLDCTTSNGSALELLHRPDTHERGQTAVVALACTSGPGGLATDLLREPIAITCDTGTTLIDPAIAKGNAYGPGPGQHDDPDLTDPVWQYAVYADTESLTCAGEPCDKTFWNIAIGFSTTARNCFLETAATAIDAGTGFATPSNTVYPYIAWNVRLTTDSPTPTRACGRHQLDGSSSGISTLYTSPAGSKQFSTKFDGASLSAAGGLPASNSTSTSVDVSFDTEGGSACPNKTVTVGSAYGTLCSPTLAGKAFTGWWTGDNGTGSQVTAGSLVTHNANHTLHARYVAVDSTFSGVALLILGNGAHLSTTIVDSGPAARTVTVSGNASISTTQSMFGGSSVAFDGSGDFLSVGQSSAFDFGTEDHTVEAWIWWDGTYVNTGRIIYATGGASSLDQFGIFSGFGLIWAGVYANVPANYPPINQWSHVAATRQGSTVRIFINGVQTATGTQANAVGRSNAAAFIGFRGFDGYHPWKGYIDSVRITKGTARYTSNFTPPNSDFPTF